MILKTLEMACRLFLCPCSLLVGGVTLKAHGQQEQQESLYFHTQLTRTPVSAAIAGHMTEAVAGMTAWALATRRGGPEKVEGAVQGCELREREGTAPLPGGSPCLL